MLHKIRILNQKQIDRVLSSNLQAEVVGNHLKSCIEMKGFSHQDGILDMYVDQSDHDALTCSNYRSGFTYKEYLSGDNYGWHSDEITNADGMRLDVSTTLFLNEDYEGGEFTVATKRMKPKARSAVVFPSNFMYPHQADVVTKGTRWSIVSWLM